MKVSRIIQTLTWAALIAGGLTSRASAASIENPINNILFGWSTVADSQAGADVVADLTGDSTMVAPSQLDFAIPTPAAKAPRDEASSDPGSYVNAPVESETVAFQGWTYGANVFSGLYGLYGFGISPGLHGSALSNSLALNNYSSEQASVGYFEDSPYSLTGQLAVLASPAGALNSARFFAADATSVPEPATMLLFATGLAAVIFTRRGK